MEQQNSLAGSINDTLTPVADFVSSIVFFSININGVDLPIVVVWLIGAGIVTTVYLRFVNIRGFFEAFRIVRSADKRGDHPGEITHFQALTAALSGTVGLGNIASVPVAIALGGPGVGLLDGACGLPRHDDEIRRMHARREVSPGQSGRHRVRGADVLHRTCVSPHGRGALGSCIGGFLRRHDAWRLDVRLPGQSGPCAAHGGDQRA